MYDQQALDLKKGTVHSNWRILAEIRLATAPYHTAMETLELVLCRTGGSVAIAQGQRSSRVDQKNSLEQMIHDMLCENMEVWRTWYMDDGDIIYRSDLGAVLLA